MRARSVRKFGYFNRFPYRERRDYRLVVRLRGRRDRLAPSTDGPSPSAPHSSHDPRSSSAAYKSRRCVTINLSMASARAPHVLSKRAAITWLQVVLVAVLIYSIVLVVAGSTAHSLFKWFGFGPDSSIDSVEVRNYLKLPYMVLGAVMSGWSWMMIQLVRGPLRDGSRWAYQFGFSFNRSFSGSLSTLECLSRSGIPPTRCSIFRSPSRSAFHCCAFVVECFHQTIN